MPISKTERKRAIQSAILSRVDDLELILADDLAQGSITHEEYMLDVEEYTRQRNRVYALFGYEPYIQAFLLEKDVR